MNLRVAQEFLQIKRDWGQHSICAGDGKLGGFGERSFGFTRWE
jgi:hypothetical protein